MPDETRQPDPLGDPDHEENTMTDQTPAQPTEGWTWLTNSPRWHYFRDGRSLCRKWMSLSNSDLEPDLAGRSKDECAACRRARDKERQREVSNAD